MNKFDTDNIFDEYTSQTAFLKNVSQFYRHNLNNNDNVLNYISGINQWPKQRGISDVILKQFQIGYAGVSEQLVEFVSMNNMNEALLYSTGIFTKDGEDTYDSFYNRVMFPLQDVSGGIVGFSGRIWKEGDVRPKFINSPSTAAFSKSFLLYGLNFAIDAMRELGFAWVVEGIPDVVACVQAGVYNVVAPCGTYITKYHLQLLKSIINKLSFCFDNDAAGMKALSHAQTLCKELNIENTSVTLVGAKDPDELLHKGGKGEAVVRTFFQDPFHGA